VFTEQAEPFADLLTTAAPDAGAAG